MKRHERHERPGEILERALSTHDVQRGRSEQRVDLDISEHRGSEEEELRHEVVEPPRGSTNDQDPPGLEGQGRLQSELEICRILLLGVAFESDALPRERREPGRADRVEIADREVDTKPGRECVIGTAVDRDQKRIGWDRLECSKGRWCSTGKNHHCVDGVDTEESSRRAGRSNGSTPRRSQE